MKLQASTRFSRAILVGTLAVLALAGCGGGDNERQAESDDGSELYYVAVSTRGLVLRPIEIALNPTRSVTQSNDTHFFMNVDAGTPYDIRVIGYPEGLRQHCEVIDGVGIVNSDVTVYVLCEAQYPVRFNVIGLDSGLDLDLNLDAEATDTPLHQITGRTIFQSVTAGAGSGEFTRALAPGTRYQVYVSRAPPGKQCQVAGHGADESGSRYITDGDPPILNIYCGDATVSYTVSGLKGTGLTVRLSQQLDQEIDEVPANGRYTFDTTLATGTSYFVLVEVQPVNPAQLCVVTNGEGVAADSDIDNVFINCRSKVEKSWRFDKGDTQYGLPLASGRAEDEAIYRTYHHGGAGTRMGPMLNLADEDLFTNLLDGPGADAAVYSNETGYTYWLATEAHSDGEATLATIETQWAVQREEGDPRFTLTLSDLTVAGFIDRSGSSPYAPGLRHVEALASLEVRAHRIHTLEDGSDWVDPVAFQYNNDRAFLYGIPGFDASFWAFDVQTLPSAQQPIIPAENMIFHATDYADLGTQEIGDYFLRVPVPIEVDLGPLMPGERALIVVTSVVEARNRHNFESAAISYLRDPVTFDPERQDQSIAVTEITGLTPIPLPNVPEDFVPIADMTPAPVCGSSDLPRAVLQLASTTYSIGEAGQSSGAAKVVRTGGTQGMVSARLRMVSGSAQAGTDFEATEYVVRFGDGDDRPRSVPILPLDDSIIEGPETLTLVLDQPSGCADLGANTSATVTLVDDDAPTSASYTIGGTVTGLIGSGLVIETLLDQLPINSNGAFQFTRDFPSGYIYRVVVANQPQNPRQACTVTGGEGGVGNADVTGIQIHCTTLPESGSLDSTFGTGGRAWVSDLGAIAFDTALARQADGKLLMVAGNNRLMRYLPGGAPDPAFGTAGDGIVTVTSGQSGSYNLEAVAVQPDGRILVAGNAPNGVSGRADMLVARYDASGTPDTTFAAGQGLATFDFGTWNDAASDLVLLPDGSILVVGRISDASGSGATDFAVLKLTAGGQIDTNYGAGGWARVNLAGGYDVAWSGALTADGGLVLVGRVASSGGANADIGIAKFTAAGLPDPTFGPGGNGVIRPITAFHDEARDAVVLSDGSILVVGLQQPGSTNAIWLARYFANGLLDPGFGNQGLATLPANMHGTALAVKTDGSILVAGELLPTGATQADFGIARFTSAGQVDTGFGNAGVLTLDMYGGYDTPGAMLLQPDGFLVIAGRAYNGSSVGRGLARLLP